MRSEDVIVGEGTPWPLEGLLTLPDDARGPVPAVVFVHGSGPSDRDERVKALTPFKDLAEGLARAGIASVRYDKRTFAYAKQLRKVDLTVREETIEDAVSAAELLRADERVSTGDVFVIGHSMGAMLAPRIDAEGGAFRGLVLMAGTPYRLEEVMLRQISQGTRSSSRAYRLLARLERRLLAGKVEGVRLLSDDEARSRKLAGAISLYYLKEAGERSAADYLLDSSKPVIIMQGARDVQVLPEVDYARFRELLAHRDNVEWHLYEGLNHAFVEACATDISQAVKEFKVERHIGDEVIGDIATFVWRHASVRP